MKTKQQRKDIRRRRMESQRVSDNILNELGQREAGLSLPSDNRCWRVSESSDR